MNYFKIVLGKGNKNRNVASDSDYIGIDYDIKQDLSKVENLSDFVRGRLAEINPEQSKPIAGFVDAYL